MDRKRDEDRKQQKGSDCVITLLRGRKAKKKCSYPLCGGFPYSAQSRKGTTEILGML